MSRRQWAAASGDREGHGVWIAEVSVAVTVAEVLDAVTASEVSGAVTGTRFPVGLCRGSRERRPAVSTQCDL